jgi:uncharacterized protein (TIGR02118 family)
MKERKVIKLTFALRRLPHLSRSEFQRYWREEHAPLVKKNAEALRIRRYVQLHALDHPANEALRASRQAPEPYDGVAELWWESFEDLAEAMAGPRGQEIAQELLEDERRFIDFSRSPLWLGEEHVVIAALA